MYVVEVEYKIFGAVIAHTMDVRANTFEEAIDMAHQKVKSSEPQAEEIKVLSAEQVEGA